MKTLITGLLAFCIFGFGFVLQAQNTIAASGGNGSGSGGTVSYTIGQVVYTTSTSTSGSVVHGVQQPYEISVVTSLEEANDIDLICSAYPNPSSDFLTLRIEKYESQDLSYRLYYITGSLLGDKKISGSETIIQMGSFMTGTYILKVSSSGKELKTFKIIKK
jgi:hypothetical protein